MVAASAFIFTFWIYSSLRVCALKSLCTSVSGHDLIIVLLAMTQIQKQELEDKYVEGNYKIF